MTDTTSAPTPTAPGLISRVLSAVKGAVLAILAWVDPHLFAVVLSWLTSGVSGALSAVFGIVKAPWSAALLFARNPSSLVVLVPVLVGTYVGGHVVGVERMKPLITTERASAKVDADNAARSLASALNAVAAANARVKALEDELTAMQQAAKAVAAPKLHAKKTAAKVKP